MNSNTSQGVCQKCGIQNTDSLNQYVFTSGCVTSFPPGPDPLNPSGGSLPGRCYEEIIGSHKVWLCDGCIHRKYISQFKFSIAKLIVIALMYLAFIIFLYYFWKPVCNTLRKINFAITESPIGGCFACPLLILGVVIFIWLLGFHFYAFGLVLDPFSYRKKMKKKTKIEIGNSMAIEVSRKSLEDSVNWINKEGDALTPRRVMVFWSGERQK